MSYVPTNMQYVTDAHGFIQQFAGVLQLYIAMEMVCSANLCLASLEREFSGLMQPPVVHKAACSSRPVLADLRKQILSFHMPNWLEGCWLFVPWPLAAFKNPYLEMQGTLTQGSYHS